MTYDELVKKLKDLPNIVIENKVKNEKRELSRKRSSFLGGGRRK